MCSVQRIGGSHFITEKNSFSRCFAFLECMMNHAIRMDQVPLLCTITMIKLNKLFLPFHRPESILSFRENGLTGKK